MVFCIDCNFFRVTMGEPIVTTNFITGETTSGLAMPKNTCWQNGTEQVCYLNAKGDCGQYVLSGTMA